MGDKEAQALLKLIKEMRIDMLYVNKQDLRTLLDKASTDESLNICLLIADHAIAID